MCNKHAYEVSQYSDKLRLATRYGMGGKIGFWQPFVRRLRRTGRKEPSEKSPTVKLTLVSKEEEEEDFRDEIAVPS